MAKGPWGAPTIANYRLPSSREARPRQPLPSAATYSAGLQPTAGPLPQHPRASTRRECPEVAILPPGPGGGYRRPLSATVPAGGPPRRIPAPPGGSGLTRRRITCRNSEFGNQSYEQLVAFTEKSRNLLSRGKGFLIIFRVHFRPSLRLVTQARSLRPPDSRPVAQARSWVTAVGPSAG
jgi:hypothetical protein